MAGTITVSLVSMVGDEGGKKRASERKNEEGLRRGTAHSLFFSLTENLEKATVP